MSFSLKVANGDLVLAGNQFAIVSGVDKLKQDLTLWLAERFGIDRFHPAMGSNLQNFIGGVIGYGTQSMVYSEVLRVLTNYQRVQTQDFRAFPSNFALSELLWNINSVDVGVGYDQVSILVSVANAQRQPVSLSLNQGT